MVNAPTAVENGYRSSTRAKPAAWLARAWVLAGCVCLSLAARAQEAEPSAPASVPSIAPVPRTAEAPASAAPTTTDPADHPPVVARTFEAAAADGSVEGLASYYARKFAGRRTASGEVFDPQALTMAHRSWPFGTAVRVTHLASGRSVVVRVNDRGPHVRRRVADLSPAAARALGMLHEGITRVRLDVLPSPAAGR